VENRFLTRQGAKLAHCVLVVAGLAENFTVSHRNLVAAYYQRFTKAMRDCARFGLSETPRGMLWRFAWMGLFGNPGIRDDKRHPEAFQQSASVARGRGKNQLH